MVEGVQTVGNEPERIIPRDWLVVRRPTPQNHGLSDASLLREPVVTSLGELRHAVLTKELGFDAFTGVLLTRRLSAILTKLGDRTLFCRWVGPCASRAIEATGLIELGEHANAFHDAKIRQCAPH